VDPVRSKQIEFVPREGGPPLAIARTEGATLVTDDGRRILDAAGGAIVANIGHGRREVAEVAARTLEQTSYLVPPFATESRVALVERLRERWLPGGISRVALTSGGSESMDAALRLARLHFVAKGEPQRWKLIGRDLAYHGTTLATLAVGGHQKRRAGFEPLLLDLPKAPACYCLRCPLGRTYPACEIACADALARVIEREGPETVAAFVAEPVVGSTAGALVPPTEYWPRVAEICREHGVLLIADEVMTGFGRTGRRFAVEHWDLTPDILVGGKGLSGGYAPIGGLFATDAVLAPIAAARSDFMFFTYGAHPSACAVADKVLEILEREDLVRRAAAMGEQLGKALARLAAHPHVGQIRGLGLLWAIELVRDRERLEPFPTDARLTQRVVAAGLQHGVFFYPGGSDPARDVVVLGPPFTITPDEIEQIAATLERAIDEAVARVGS
jgi:adenosylmethionine-8-amino-7-oxononanoate aminotransferase